MRTAPGVRVCVARPRRALPEPPADTPRARSMDSALRKKLGWQMKGIKLPPSTLFGTLDPDFIEQRRASLHDYMQQLCQIPGVTAFHKHFCSQELKAFLRFDELALGKVRWGGVGEALGILAARHRRGSRPALADRRAGWR